VATSHKPLSAGLCKYRWVLERARLAQVTIADFRQGELFSDDYAQSDASDGEPVFWSSGGQGAPRDDFI
jgi:hypothetical protein